VNSPSFFYSYTHPDLSHVSLCLKKYLNRRLFSAITDCRFLLVGQNSMLLCQATVLSFRTSEASEKSLFFGTGCLRCTCRRTISPFFLKEKSAISPFFLKEKSAVFICVELAQWVGFLPSVGMTPKSDNLK